MRKYIVVSAWVVGLLPAGAMAAAPETRIDSMPPAQTNQTTANFTFSSTASNASFKCMFDTGSTYGCLGTVTAEDLAAGPHQFCVYSIDKSGTADPTPACYSWTVDLTPPTVTIVKPENGAGVFTADPIIEGTTNEPSSTINVFADGSTRSSGSVIAGADGKWTFNKTLGLSDGPHTVSATATDPAGNVGARSAEVSLRVSSVTPETTIVEHPPQIHTSRHSVFEFASSTGATHFECQLDAATTFTDCDQVALFKNLEDKEHTLQVRAKDSAGNVDPTPESYKWTVNTQAGAATCPSTTPTDEETKRGCSYSGGSPVIVLSLLGGAWLLGSARRRRAA